MPGRDARLVVNVHARWEDAGPTTRLHRVGAAFYAAAQPFASGGAYVNFMTADEAARVPSAVRRQLRAAGRSQAAFDPDNVFHVNQNIAP
jgi:hypothetical protein